MRALCDSQLREIGKGWSVYFDPCSDRSFQKLVFDLPGAPTNYHGGPRSEYLINGVTGEVSYLDGDPSRSPTKIIVAQACEALTQLKEEGKLFGGPDYDDSPDPYDGDEVDWDEFSDKKGLQISLGGIDGYARICSWGIEFCARWASHTGYWSGLYGKPSASEIMEAADALYKQSVRLQFVLGRGDCEECNWPDIWTSWKHDGLAIRVPDWCRRGIREHLLSLGAVHECKLNERYTFPAGVDAAEIRYLLAPLFEPGTRLTDQSVLLERLKNVKQQIALF